MLTAAAPAQIWITEWMYQGGNTIDGASGADEFIEFTNVGLSPIDMTGWSFDDSSRAPGSQSLSAFGTVNPGESVVLADIGPGIVGVLALLIGIVNEQSADGAVPNSLMLNEANTVSGSNFLDKGRADSTLGRVEGNGQNWLEFLVVQGGENYSFHTGGAEGCFADGSVRMLNSSLDAVVGIAIITRAGGEATSTDEF